MRRFLALAILLTLSHPAKADVKPLTLEDCYKLALQQSETVAIDKEKLAETEAQFHQALGSALPSVDFLSVDKRQENNASSSFNPNYAPQRNFFVNQPLFSGFKEFAAMSGAKALKQQKTHEWIRAEQLLFADVSDAFYTLMEQRNDLEILITISQALEARIADLKHWVRIGRSRPSEASAAQAQLEQVKAQIEQARGLETTVRQLLEFLTGGPVGDLVDSPERVPALSPVESYLGKAHLRPDVQAADEAERVSEKQVTIARAGHWPNASLGGNYYTQRSGIQSGISWDASLLIDFPIFKGGQTRGQVDQARAQLQEARLQKQFAQRSSAREIRDAYAQVQTALRQMSPLENAYRAAEQSYKGQKEDYRHSRANNIDVLQSLQILENTRRDCVRARSEARRLYWRLRVATGETI
jgi:outer membrane protein